MRMIADGVFTRVHAVDTLQGLGPLPSDFDQIS